MYHYFRAGTNSSLHPTIQRDSVSGTPEDPTPDCTPADDSISSPGHDPATPASPHVLTPSSEPTTRTTRHDSTEQPIKRKKKKKVVCFSRDQAGGRVHRCDRRENVRCYSLKSICPCGDRKKQQRARSNSNQSETGQHMRNVGVGVGGETRATEGDPWRRKGYNREGDPWRKGNYNNEGYVRDLPPRNFSIVSKGALGDLIKQVIVEETSSDVEHERIL